MPLMKIGDTESLLQSNNFTANSGSKLDLSNGNYDARSSKGQVLISGSGSPYFKIGIPSNTSDVSYSNSLFLLDNDNYYLKSSTYNETSFIKTNDSYAYNTYKQPSNSIVKISDYVAISPSGTVYSTTGSQNNLKVNSSYNFPPMTGVNIGTDQDGNNIMTSQTSNQVKQTYLAQLIPNLEVSENKNAGFKLDLKNNIIHGYDLYLKGTNSSLNNKPSFILDSGAPEIPFKIGSNFSVSWDGVLTCNKINSLNDDGRDDMAISINENFYVTKSGAAGGGSGSFSSGNMGGFSSGGSGGRCNGALEVDGHLTVKGDISCQQIACTNIFAGTDGVILGNLEDYEVGDIGDYVKELKRRVDSLFEEMANHTHKFSGDIYADLKHDHSYSWTLAAGSSTTGQSLSSQTHLKFSGSTNAATVG